MNPCELTTFISTLAIYISNNYTEAELNLLSAIFTQLGDSITTILAQKQLCSIDKCIINDKT